MKKIDNFRNCLNVLKNADFQMANENEIYRTGVIGQFNLTFELAWKSLQAVLQEYGVIDFKAGSPREVLQIAYRVGFLDEPEIWLMMLKTRNVSVHIYDEKEINEMLCLIRDQYIGALTHLLDTLMTKHIAAQSGLDNGKHSYFSE